VKVLRIHGCQSPSSPRSHQATEIVPSPFSLILPWSSSSYWKRAGPWSRIGWTEPLAQGQSWGWMVRPPDRKGVDMRIGLTGIFVDDQDRAERFYTEVLGFQVKTSAAYGPGERWLSVVSPEDPDGVQLVLHLTDEPARAFRQASRELGRPVISLATKDCAGDAERLKAKGVVFVKEPGRMAYGGMDAVFDDTCGNLVNLHQD
jgi:catechol 2,3-dioxygenase-like lactoylglutathione lyase family enzyme